MIQSEAYMPKLFLLLSVIISNVAWAQAPRLMMPDGYSKSDIISELRFSPDRKYFVTVSNDKTIKGWDSKTGKLLYSKPLVSKFVFTPDDKNVFIILDDGRCSFLDRNSGDVLYTIIEDTAKIRSIKLSPDNKKFVIVSDALKGNVIIRNIKTGKQIQRLTIEKTSDMLPTAKTCFSPDGKFILTKVGGRDPLIFNIKTGISKKIEASTSVFNEPFFSPDGKMIVTDTHDSAKIWDVKTGSPIMSILLGDDFLFNRETIFSSDSKYLLTYNKRTSPSLLVFSIKSRGIHYSYTLSDDSNNPVQISKDNKIVILAGEDGVVKIIDLKTGQMKDTINFTYNNHALPLTTLLLSSDNKNLITTGIDQSIVITDFISGKRKYRLGGYKENAGISFIQFSKDEKYIEEVLLDCSVKTWEISTGKLKSQYLLYGNSGKITSSAFKGDGSIIVTGTSDNKVKVWDTKLGKITQILNGHSDVAKFAKYSNDDKYFVTTSWHDKKAIIWESATGKLLTTLLHPNIVTSADFSPDSKYVVTACGDGNAMIWDRESGKLLNRLEVDSNVVMSVEYNYDGSLILTNTVQLHTGLKLWQSNTGKQICTLPDDLFSYDAKFIPVNNNVVYAKEIGKITFWNAQKCQVLKTIEDEVNDPTSSVKYTEDGKYMMLRWKNDSITLLNAVTGKTEKVIYFPHLYQDITFCRNGKYFFTSLNSELQVYDVDKFSLQYKLIAIDSADYISQIPAGYYQCTPAAAKQLYYVTKDLKIITFEQLDVKYNRPDKVLEALGNTDTALIQSYRKAYEKRIKKLRVDTTSFRDGYSVPEVDFVNRAAIASEQKTSKLSLHIKGMDSTYKLDRFNVWVNEVPVYGQRGISIRKRNKKNLDTTITITLSQGENNIETSFTNVNGTESYRIPLMVNYAPAVAEKTITHFIGIGIDRFADTKYNLQYSAKDIRDLSIKLKEKYGNDIIIDTLFNEQVSVANIKVLKKKLLQTLVNDKVIIAYSGHGLLSKEYDYYLSTYSINFKKPEQNGLLYDELENLLDSIPARKKLMMIDACHSGEVDKDEAFAMNKTAASLGLKKGVVNDDEDQPVQQVGLKNSFELMQSLFVNVGKSTGATIISAAAGNQFALERGDLKNGVFTYSILEAMTNHPTLKISELKKIIGQRVEELTQGMQKPTYRNEPIAVDWNIW